MGQSHKALFLTPCYDVKTISQASVEKESAPDVYLHGGVGEGKEKILSWGYRRSEK